MSEVPMPPPDGPTPRTDSELLVPFTNGDLRPPDESVLDVDPKFVTAFFSRTLERELATWKEMAQRLDAKVLDEQRDHVKTCGYHDATKAELADAKAREADLLEELESAARQLCHTSKVENDYNGQVAGTLVTDSGAISTSAALLERMADLKRFRIVGESGRMVVGYWPENDPLRPPAGEGIQK